MTEPRPHPVMPQLSQGFFGFHHTVDSALEVLSRLGVSASRITIRMAGLGYPDRWIAAQEPPAGAPLGPGQRITLHVAGLGFFRSLPVGMWHRGGEREPGIEEMVAVLDDPLQKALHWVREGARLFDVREENRPACARWIELFGLDPAGWPPEHWYHLALLLPNLHRLAGTDRGIRLALQLLLGLPLHRIGRRRGYRQIAAADCSLVGARMSRLGVDLVAGDRVEALADLVLHIGPAPLKTYYHFQQPRQKDLLASVLRLSASCYQSSRVQWRVLDPAKAPRLGAEEQNSRLGINTHLGAAA